MGQLGWLYFPGSIETTVVSGFRIRLTHSMTLPGFTTTGTHRAKVYAPTSLNATLTITGTLPASASLTTTQETVTVDGGPSELCDVFTIADSRTWGSGSFTDSYGDFEISYEGSGKLGFQPYVETSSNPGTSSTYTMETRTNIDCGGFAQSVAVHRVANNQFGFNIVCRSDGFNGSQIVTCYDFRRDWFNADSIPNATYT